MANTSEARKFVPKREVNPKAEVPLQKERPEGSQPAGFEQQTTVDERESNLDEDIKVSFEKAVNTYLELANKQGTDRNELKNALMDNSDELLRQASQSENPNQSLPDIIADFTNKKTAEMSAIKSAREGALLTQEPLSSGKTYEKNPAFTAYATEIGQDPNYVQEVAEMYDALDDRFKVGMPEDDYYGKPVKFEGIMMPPAPKPKWFKRLFGQSVGAEDLANKKALFEKAAALVSQADVVGAKDISGNVANIETAHKSDPGKEGGIK